ncbi:hypothetical protein [uncultured Flavobacterium sp.]|uniref:hypothetical protein n=1 Tax=uncultured Flavobacterium sp. TaxID=165435 RepID=UPI0025F737E6|nr:hypothetical protein [uncultured Flavobacterium sp.]
MKFILVKGSRWAGKTETIKEISKRLKPTAIRRIHISDTSPTLLTSIDPSIGISNGNYLLTVRDKCILVVTDSPTQQRTRITTIVEAAHKLNLKPSLALISINTIERLKNFDTSNELEKFGKCIHNVKIWRIPSIKYDLTEEWNKRVSYLLSIILHNL